MERRITLTGTLNNCKCGKQPQLFHNNIGYRVGDQFYFECPVCGIKLWKFPSAAEAVENWELVSSVFQRELDATPVAEAAVATRQ